MHRFLSSLVRRRSALSLIAVLVLVATVLPTSGSAGPTSGRVQASGFHPLARVKPIRPFATGSQPPTDAQCLAHGFSCYNPQEIQTAYGVSNLLAAGDDGTGQTIVIFDSFGSPTLMSDLAVFDQAFGLPTPSVTVLAPLGTDPFDPNDATEVGWAEETSLDVQWAHAMAPGASIVLMTSPVAETEGIPGMPQFYKLETMAMQQNLGQIWSQSWGATENGLFQGTAGTKILNEFNAQYQQAGKQGISIFASAGDSGVSNLENNQTTYYPFPTVIFPASSPFVTAVGGTTLTATTGGVYQSEVVWGNSSGATGGGVSQFFAEPKYQVNNLPPSDQTILNGFRAIPDIGYNADPNTAVDVYLGFTGSGVVPGWYFFGGTSEGAPQWAGITADLNQAAGHSLGFLNPLVYQVGNSSSYSTTFHDITSGNNSFNGLTGYNATTGWDPTTGWGTPRGTALNALRNLALRSQ